MTKKPVFCQVHIDQGDSKYSKILEFNQNSLIRWTAEDLEISIDNVLKSIGALLEPEDEL